MTAQAPTSVLFVHSPLLGPSSWARAAAEMRRRGFAVAVPDLTMVADAPPPRAAALIDAAARSAADLPDQVAVIGHSGAGPFLPAIADRLDTRAPVLLFVDTAVPPRRGTHRTADRLASLLDEQTQDGRLRRWLEWWPKEVIADLLPDEDDRAALLQDMPALPRAFYDEPVAVPENWTSRRCAYVQLSAAYDDAFAEAGQRDWPRAALQTDHLAIRTRPTAVVAAVEALLSALAP